MQFVARAKSRPARWVHGVSLAIRAYTGTKRVPAENSNVANLLVCPVPFLAGYAYSKIPARPATGDPLGSPVFYVCMEKLVITPALLATLP